MSRDEVNPRLTSEVCEVSSAAPPRSALSFPSTTMTARTAVPSSSEALTRQPRALARNRRLLIAGVITVLPSAAIMPSLLGDAKSPALLAAVDELTSVTHDVAAANEQAVTLAGERAAIEMKPSGGNAPPAVMLVATEAPAPLTGKHVEFRYFNGRPVRAVRTIEMLVTAYSPDARSCGESADGITASGYSVWTNGMKMVAADTDVLPFGTLVSIPGYDDAAIVPVLDRGGAIRGHRLDVLYPTHDRAVQWGAQRLAITIWEYADGLPGDFAIAHR